MKKTNKGMLATILSLSLSVGILSGCGGSESTTSTGETGSEQFSKENPLIVKFSHVVTEQSPKGQAATKFKELLEQKTEGKVTVELYPSSQLYGDKDELEALQAGNVHVIAPSTAKLVGLNPSFQVNDLPFLFESSESVHKFWDGPTGQKLLNSLDNYNIKGLATWDLGFKVFTSNKPIEKLEDFKGQKFRTQAGKVLEAQFKALDAGGATIPFAEVYTALQQGTVDGQENTWTSIDQQKYQEVQKNLLVSNHGRIDYVLLTNKEWYEGLPEDIKKAFDETVAESTQYQREINDQLNKEAEDNLRKAGKFQFFELSNEEREKFRKAMEEVSKEFEESIGKEYIDAARNS